MPKPTHQDSPKVPEEAKKRPLRWLIRRCRVCRETQLGDYASFACKCPDPDIEDIIVIPKSDAIPVSALLSDEAVEGYAREVWGWNKGVSPPLSDDERSAARAAISAAIEATGGDPHG